MGQEELKSPKIYFKQKNENIINTAVIDSNDSKEKVKLTISLEECIPNTYYQMKINSINNNKTEFLFETEKVKPNNENKINYETTFLLTYLFEKEQILIFNIYINNEIIDYKTTLGCIVGSRNNTLTRKISKERVELIKIKSTKVDASNKKKLKLHFRVNDNQLAKKSFPKDKFYFKISSEKDLYRSELISNDGYFKPAIIPLYCLTPSFNVTFYNTKLKILKSFSNLTYEQIMEMNNQSFVLDYNSNKNKKAKILIDVETLGNTKTFLDYIEEGMQINLSIGIDFSKTNINLHKFYNNRMNRYEEAIKYCGDVVAYYDSDQLIPAWGFGADNIPENFDRMCFPINFNENPNIEKIDGVLKEYKNCLNKITLSEPAHFSPIINHLINIIEEDKENINTNYHILLLLTDGKYDDREKTIDSIVKASKLPLSIIIIGLQDSDSRQQGGGNFDIVYMIDATGSMGNYLQAAKDQCINISNELKEKFQSFNFRFGGVFYRDPIDSKTDKNEVFDLTDDVVSLRNFISTVNATGGGDFAEDWAGGYELALDKIKWRNGLKLIIHICDADAHGKEYTSSGDNHPNEGYKLPPLLKRCVENQIKIIGFNVNNGAKTSFNKCKKEYDKYDTNRKGLFKIQDFSSKIDVAANFKNLIVEAATFAAMEELDGDDEPLVNSKGEKWERDIVQFVPYDKYKNNPKMLAEQVLEEVPTQVVEYYKNKNKKEIQNKGFLFVDS